MSQLIIIYEESDCELLIDLELTQQYNKSISSKTTYDTRRKNI